MNVFDKIKALLGHWRWVVNYEFIPACQARRRIRRTLERVKTKAARGEKLKVVFLLGEVSKWKVQSLYDWMKASGFFTPSVALTLPEDVANSMSAEERRRHFEKARSFLAERGISSVEAFEPESGKYRDIKSLDADILFYYQPWSLPTIQQPHVVAETMLTCYVPYYVPNYGDLSMDARQPFHRTLWTYFILNEEWGALFRDAVLPWMTASRIVGLGHPMLDVFNGEVQPEEPRIVIYAPHWSIDVPGNENAENYGTFHLNGKEMLAYAQRHREHRWVFKPHPDLKKVLLRTGWNQGEVNAYYDAWNELGETCETGNYPALFMRSSLMITDCGSFLTEYACTGNPILHLICPTCKKVPFPQSKRLYDLYYQAHDTTELQSMLSLLLERGEDPRREERVAMVEKMKLCGNNAGTQIGEWLKAELSR